MRKSIRSEIAAVRPLDALERAQIEETLSWINSGADLCRQERPATPPRYLVCSFVVVDGDWRLLGDHTNACLWLPPGGHVEPGEHPADTVAREAQEELGFAADFLVPGPVFPVVTETVAAVAGHVDVSHWHVLNGDRGSRLSRDRSEFAGIRWFHRSTFIAAPCLSQRLVHRGALPLDRTDPHLARFMAKSATAVLR